jgi:arginine utilization regulatory protein
MPYVNKNENRNIEKNSANYTFESIIGNNKNFKRLVDFGHKIAHNNSSVLILGETGTGKELFAHSIHNESNYKNGPFIAINCAAIPDTLMESVLFGTIEGAFTGAKNNQGLLFQAQNGTIFLDEINSLNLDCQAKLLRFLQDKTLRSVGSNEQQKILCRIISAVNKDIEEEIKSGKIREDLYYRLATVVLSIPPLRERIDDVPVLARHFIDKYSKEFNNNINEIDQDLMDLFMNYSWSGNVRELEHIIESAMNLVEENEKTLKFKHLSTYLQQKFSTINTFFVKEKNKETYSLEKSLHEILDEVEKQVIIERLLKNEGNITQTAKDLGIFRQALQYRMKKHHIDEF